MNYWGYGSYYNNFDNNLGLFSLLIPFTLFDLILRGFALWRAAKKDQNIWFISLLIINSMGILPLIYLIINRDQKQTSKKTLKSK